MVASAVPVPNQCNRYLHHHPIAGRKQILPVTQMIFCIDKFVRVVNCYTGFSHSPVWRDEVVRLNL